MGLRRVVITGMGAVSPLGRGVERMMERLFAGESGIRHLPELDAVKGLRTRVAGMVEEVDAQEIPRKFRRSMSRLSVFAALAAQEALESAGISPAIRSGGRLGVCVGTTVSSPIATQECYQNYFKEWGVEDIKGTLFFQVMNHSCASNLVQLLGITGRVLSPSAACSTGNQAIGYGYEMIAFGKQDYMLCGGTEEFHPLTAATFDILGAASTRYNDRPEETPRPFDRDRDGMVCAEGCGMLFLESLESAQSRGGPILAEIIGYATNADPLNIADPHVTAIEECMRLALKDAGIVAHEVDYINAHATATLQGDAAEAEAIARVFGDRVPVSSLKGHMGHTLAASGALEAIATIEMMRRGKVIPTLHLEHIDPSCEGIYHPRGQEERPLTIALKNNFALGGVNSCTVFRRLVHDR